MTKDTSFWLAQRTERCSCLCLLAVLAEPVSFYPAQGPGERIFCSFSFLLSPFSVPSGVWLELWLLAEMSGERQAGLKVGCCPWHLACVGWQI